MIDDILTKLQKSKFRSSFKLSIKDKEYINKVGLNTITKHAYDFINKRIALKYIKNDGKQTPFKNHPVFVAQHATATCCRECLYKWHHIAKNKELSKNEIDYIVKVIMTWIKRQIN